MAPVQIKGVYDYYSAKRTTLFFITEEELLKGRSREDFADFWSNLCYNYRELTLSMPNIVFEHLKKQINLIPLRENKP